MCLLHLQCDITIVKCQSYKFKIHDSNIEVKNNY